MLERKLADRLAGAVVVEAAEYTEPAEPAESKSWRTIEKEFLMN